MINETLIPDSQPIVLGLSGGPDSVCLLLELLAMNAARREGGGLGNPIVCAHVNHGLRGDESDGDETYVRSLCERLGVPVEVKRIDAAVLAKEKGLTVEEAGREARYAFFDELCQAYLAGVTASPYPPAPLIATAHNQDDQVETILMRILRGTGTDGLAGIAPIRKSAAGFDIARPLLGVSRKEIDSRLATYGETPRIDTSNLEAEHFRNKLRLEVLPYLKDALGIDLRRGFLRLAENAAEDRDYFEAVVAGILEPYKTLATLPAPALATAHPAIRHRLIRAVFAELGLRHDIASVHLAAADRLLETFQNGGEASGKRVEFPCDYTFGIIGKEAVFRAPADADPDWKPRRRF
ncbi:MAG: tRNA lysidine(34) synthetase TilS [Clostridiales bacterium]|nr:tRNA lysidine(34) synthetase TilS [Clostridiales bacterium]